MAIYIDSELMGETSHSPIAVFTPIYSPSQVNRIYESAQDYQWGIMIGCINDTVHDGVAGPLDYFSLFQILSSKGYDPLRPIRGPKAIEHIGRKLGDMIYHGSRNNHARAWIERRVESYAIEIQDFVKDYIYGSVAVPSFGDGQTAKAPLDKSTISTRWGKLKSDPSLYGGEGGVEEPLYETGDLFESIRYRIFHVDMAEELKRRRSHSATMRELEKSKHRTALSARLSRKASDSDKAKKPKSEKAKLPKKVKSAIDVVADRLAAKNREVEAYRTSVYSKLTLHLGAMSHIDEMIFRNKRRAMEAGATEDDLRLALEEIGITGFKI